MLTFFIQIKIYHFVLEMKNMKAFGKALGLRDCTNVCVQTVLILEHYVDLNLEHSLPDLAHKLCELLKNSCVDLVALLYLLQRGTFITKLQQLSERKLTTKHISTTYP